MSIEANGHLFRTLNNEMFVNGQKVTEAYCNGIKVYPDDNVLYLRLKGQFAATYTHTFTDVRSNKVDIFCTISASYEMVVRIDPYDDDYVPQWEVVFNKDVESIYDPLRVLKVKNAGKLRVMSSNITINASRIRSNGNIFLIVADDAPLSITTDTLEPLGVITMFNGMHRGGKSSRLFEGTLKSIGRKVPSRLTTGYYESDSTLVRAQLVSEESGTLLTINGISISLAEVFDTAHTVIILMAAPRTTYTFRTAGFTHKVGVDSAVEISPAQAASML